jgi:hypothetical protein
MGQTTDQIETHIENRREDLKSNLQELEGRVKSAVDWRHYFNQNPGMMIAAAFGGGVLLSAIMRGRRARGLSQAASSSISAEAAPSIRTRTRHEVLDKLDAIKSALVGVAATKFKGMLSEAVPGFSEHLAHAESERGAGLDEPARDSTH